MPLNNQGILSHHSKVFDFLNRAMDMGIITLTFAGAHYLNRIGLDLGCTIMMLSALIYFELCAAMTGLYASQRGYTTFQHLGNVLPALAGMFVLEIGTTVLTNRNDHLTNPVLVGHWVVSCTALMVGWRFSLRQLLVFLRKRGLNTRRVAIVGCSATAKSLADKIRSNPWMGLKIDGFYDNTTACHFVPIKGDFNKLLERVNSGIVDQVYIALPSEQAEKITALVDALSDATATVFIIPDVFTFELMNSHQTSIDGIPAISIYDSPFSLGDSVLKRAFDIVVSLGILSLIGLPMLAIAAAVKLTSPGPAIFRQRRYGMDGKAIDVWKFRSMTVEDNGAVVKQATRNDSRITPLGAFLRRTSLDELPQFINVLQGSMSIVGPRPHAVAHNEEYRKRIKGYMLRHKVKPGITGWAQINGWRGETDTLEKMEKRVEHDLHYIRHWNIWLDVQILFLTVFKGFVGKNVY